MKHITILVPEGENNLSSIVGPYKIFNRANDYYKEKNGRELFRIQLAGITKQVDFYGGLFSVHPNVNFLDIRETNLIIIPSLNHQYEKAVKGNSALIK